MHLNDQKTVERGLYLCSQKGFFRDYLQKAQKGF